MKSIKKPKILALLQLPPPIHGASMMNQAVIKSPAITDSFAITCLPLQFASSVGDISSLRLSKFIKVIEISLRLVKALTTNRYAFVYFTLSPVGFAFYRDLLFVSILKLFRTKILYHMHGKGIKRNANTSKIKKLLYQFAFKNTFVIVLAPILRKDIETVYAGLPFIVNNGITPLTRPYPSPKTKTKTKTKTDVIQILYLSNLKTNKGILILLESLVMLRNNNLTFKTQIVGNDGELTSSELKKIIKKMGLASFVSVLGPKYDTAKNEILNSCDIFCFPTFNDAFPLVLLEAMQFGKPIVSTFEGAIADIVNNGETGLLVPQKDCTALAEALQKLILDEKLRNMMENRALEKFSNQYTLHHFEENICAVFNNITKKSNTTLQ